MFFGILFLFRYSLLFFLRVGCYYTSNVFLGSFFCFDILCCFFFVRHDNCNNTIALTGVIFLQCQQRRAPPTTDVRWAIHLCPTGTTTTTTTTTTAPTTVPTPAATTMGRVPTTPTTADVWASVETIVSSCHFLSVPVFLCFCVPVFPIPLYHYVPA